MIYLISGKMGTGKTTLAGAMLDHLGPGTIADKFARPLYEMHNAVKNTAERLGLPFGEKNRKFLEFLGTDLYRAEDKDIWVRFMQKSIEEYYSIGVKNIIIDDCRFLNELFAFDESVKIRLTCSDYSRTMLYGDQGHKSNTALDDLPDKAFDYVFDTATISPEEMVQTIC